MTAAPSPTALHRPPVVVLKFGSSVLRTNADLPWVVQQVYAHVRRGERVIAVVSAFAGVTDALYARAREHGGDEHATAALVATGEHESAALLALALDRCGVPARMLTPQAVALRTRGPALDAEPADVAAAPFERALAARPVVVFPGFCGLDDDGHTTLLGRGGSDLTALFLAERLGARCVLVKDVDGLYARDPALPGPPPPRYARLGWEDALRVGGRVVQPKTLRTARLHGRALEIRAIGTPWGAAHGTTVGPYTAEVAAPAERRPLRVALLGLGTVGGGVYERLRRRPDLFEVVRVAVRDRARHAARGVPADLLTTNPWAVLADEPDVVVEALGGVQPAAELVLAALLDGRQVVTANKAALAVHWERFAPFASGAAPRLRAAASVGGAVPVLEQVAALAAAGGVARVRGVVNGTCNYVLDRLADGLDLDAAIREAQAAGYAEPDPTFDVSGQDAAHKLRLIVALATGAPPSRIDVQGLDADTADAQRDALAAGRRVKLVASWDGANARVGLESLAADDPLAAVRAEQNAVEIETRDGRRVTLQGRGAGRAPTTTAVVADLLDVLGEVRAAAAEPRPRAAALGA